MSAARMSGTVCAVCLILIGVVWLGLADLRAERSAKDRDASPEDDPCPLCRLEDYR